MPALCGDVSVASSRITRIGMLRGSRDGYRFTHTGSAFGSSCYYRLLAMAGALGAGGSATPRPPGAAQMDDPWPDRVQQYRREAERLRAEAEKDLYTRQQL